MNLGFETPTYGSRLTMRRYFGAGNIQPADIVLQKRTQLVFGITILPLHPLTTELREPFRQECLGLCSGLSFDV